MNKLTKPIAGLCAIAMTLMVAQAAFAFTKYPNASCPDTLTIKQLKDRLDQGGPCDPNDQYPTTSAPGDTVLGVGGIITGFDKIPTGFDIYMQMTGGGPNTGIDVFLHGNPPQYDFALGDSIVVEFAAVGNFQGDVELESPNNNFSNPDIVIRKVNSGNALPPYFVGNTTTLNELPTNTNFAPYVSALVRLTGPLRVARAGGALGSRSMLVVDNTAMNPPDSVFIDYGKMTNILPPAVGTVINEIRGIGNLASRGYRIMPRDANDIDDTVPPGVTDAYAVADNKYRVVFDRDVTAGSATTTSNYTLDSFGNVDAAVTDGNAAAILTVSGTGLLHGQPETIHINGITGSANNVTMTTEATRTFLFGVLSCGEMSQPDPDTLTAGPDGCVDKALYSGPGGEYLNGGFGTRSTVTGIAVGKFGNLFYLEDGTPDPAVDQTYSRGITVFAPPAALELGHRYILAGAAQDYYQENEFTSIQYVQDVGNPGIPSPWTSLTPEIMGLGDPCDATQTQLTARDYLSTLVTLTNLRVIGFTSSANALYVVGPSPTYEDTILVENQNNVLGDYSSSNPNYPELYTHINVTGVVHFTNRPNYPNSSTTAGTFRICPRDVADITTTVGVGDSKAAILSFAVYPNPARTVNMAFSVPKATHVDLAVYDLLGRKVAQIAKGTYSAGTYRKTWNGTNAAGDHVSSGVYFYRLRAGDEVRTARTFLITD